MLFTSSFHKSIIKGIFFGLFLTLFFIFPSKTIYAQENAVTVHFFYGDGCSHCAAEESFLGSLKDLYKEKLDIQYYEVWGSPSNLELLSKVSSNLGKGYSGVPVTIIGKNYISGFSTAQTTGVQIKRALDDCLNDPGGDCEDIVYPLINSSTVSSEEVNADSTIKLPILGEINPKTVSLPLITVVLGLLDGFNPCAMWTLLFLISILLGMKSKKRRWILGASFILASGFVYFLFMVAWLNFFLFLGFVSWIRKIIGLFAILFGVYHMWKFYKNRDGGCDTADDEKRQKVFEKIREITQSKNFVLALIGIILLAMAVNLVELVCSAGFPAIYTGILALNNLPKVTYYLYILFYIFFFTLDDIIVFSIAMVTLEAVGIQSKYARISSLAGGILLAAIGILLIIKPEILMLNF